MKKIVLAIGLIIVLLSVFIGVVLVNAVGTTSSNPSLTATVMTSGLNVQGRNWGLGVPVSLFIDIQDDVHHVADVTPAGWGSLGGLKGTPSVMGWMGWCTGSFQQTIPLNGISVGPHLLIGSQDVTGLSAGAQSLLQATAPFTILVTSPVDDRTLGAIADVEGKLDDPHTGLVEIKTEVSDIADALHNVAIVKTDSADKKWASIGTYTRTTTYTCGIRHVSLTILVLHAHGIPPTQDYVQLKVRFPSLSSSNTYALDTIIDNGVRTYEFDTDRWQIVVYVKHDNAPGNEVTCALNVSTLQPQHEIGVQVAAEDTEDTTVEESFVPGPEYPEESETPVNPE